MYWDDKIKRIIGGNIFEILFDLGFFVVVRMKSKADPSINLQCYEDLKYGYL
jgi:Ca2+/Na+ antiporter